MMHALHAAIEQHWREHRPQTVRALEATGKLERAIRQAADRTVETESRLIQQRVSALQAQELVREMWAFVPEEEPDADD